jgi:hypothetical protein
MRPTSFAACATVLGPKTKRNRLLFSACVASGFTCRLFQGWRQLLSFEQRSHFPKKFWFWIAPYSYLGTFWASVPREKKQAADSRTTNKSLCLPEDQQAMCLSKNQQDLVLVEDQQDLVRRCPRSFNGGISVFGAVERLPDRYPLFIKQPARTRKTTKKEPGLREETVGDKVRS